MPAQDVDEPLADALWCIAEDRLATAQAVAGFLGADAQAAPDELVAGWWSIQVALSALDRLEVRGRDSAGIAVVVTSGDPPEMPSSADALGRSGNCWKDRNATVHVHKTAVEVGELGDNTRALRAAVADDDSLRAALARPGARCSVLAHTRWASVGLITEPNAHPVVSLPTDGVPWTFAAVNGDIDNYAAVVARHELAYPAAVTTDARGGSRVGPPAPPLTRIGRRGVRCRSGNLRRFPCHRVVLHGRSSQPPARPAGQRAGAVRGSCP